MKATIKIETEVELKTIHVVASVRYWEDSQVDGKEDTEDGDMIPFKYGDNWCPKIDIDSGKILDWPIGTTASIHYKVCDCCAFSIIDDAGKTVADKDGYVPRFLCPKENGYGDYIIMDIVEDGTIQGWKFYPDDVFND